MTRLLLGALGAGLLLAVTGPAIISSADAKPINVVVSIKSLHALVTGVMSGVATPAVLIKGGASPHATALRPSDARRLHNADIVFWTGDALETSLIKSLASLSRKTQVIALSTVPDIRLQRIRTAILWQGDKNDRQGEHDKHGHHKNHAHVQHDMHIWLSHHNAKTIVRHVANTLSRHDLANKSRYHGNATNVIARLKKLHQELRAILMPVRHVPYVVFHDAYQYFEIDFGLKPIGALSTHEARKPGARHLSALRKKIHRLKPRCIFAEPQFQPALIQTLIEGTAVKAGTLDPIGARLKPGAGMYDTLMRNLARDITRCLASIS